MRLRTLPVSIAGVLYAGALGLLSWRFSPVPWAMCLGFALLAQVASNFANEYYDFKAGLDKAGRVGPRRGVTEGDITPQAMKRATYVTLGLACVLGIALVALYGEWWMYAVGVLTALGVVAYSSGPYPLSHHGWGGCGGLLRHSACVPYLYPHGRNRWMVACGRVDRCRPYGG